MLSANCKTLRTKFGIDKCKILVIRSEQLVNSESIQLPDDQALKSLKGIDVYKYQGELESDRVLTTQTKTNSEEEYFRMMLKVRKLKQNGPKQVKAVNNWTVSLIRYSGTYVENF